MRTNKILVALTLFITALSAWAAYQLFALRYSSGEVYPPYSSLRSDPLGTKALFETFQTFPGMRAERNYRPLDTLRTQDSTILYLGESLEAVLFPSDRLCDTMESLAWRGNRLVISIQPVVAVPGFKTVPGVAPRWHFGVAYRKPKKQTDEPGITRDTLLYFADLGPEWRVLYSDKTRPLIIERQHGSGSIVLAAASYPFSNEALLLNRDAQLIANIVGPKRSAIFDEYHHHIRESVSVGGLARRYRLHGFVATLIALAILFVWKNSVSFVPAPPDFERLDAVSGKESAVGLVNLLERTVDKGDLSEVCLAEWQKVRSLAASCSPEKLGRIQSVVRRDQALPARQRSPINVYRTVSRILAERT
jgi:hypothetical protein